MRYIDWTQRKTVRPAVACRLMSFAALILLALALLPAMKAMGQSYVSNVSVGCSSPVAYGSTVSCFVNVSFGGTIEPGSASVSVCVEGAGAGGGCSVASATGSASCSTSFQASFGPGTFTVLANANGTTSTTSLTVTGKATPALSVSCSPNPITYGTQTSTCMARLSGGSGCYPGTITTSWDSNSWCSGASPVSCTGWNGVGAGSHTFSATYGGDSNNNSVSASTTLNIAAVPSSVSVSCSPNPIVYGGGNTTCTATVPPGATGNVTFTANNGGWATVALTGNTASAGGWGGGSWPVGTYPVGATYNGDGNYKASSSTTSVTINNKAPSSVFVSCSPDPIGYGGGNTTCTALVTSGATGNVAFTANNGVWTTVPLSGNAATASGWGGASWAPNTYPVGATYLGDGNYSPSIPESTTITINPVYTVTQVSSGLNPSTYGQNVTFTSLVSTGGFAPTGKVTFLDFKLPIGSGNISAAIATNLAPYSQQIGNAATWSGYCGPLNNMTMNTSDLAAPDTTYTATKFVVPNTTGCVGSSSQGAVEEITGGLVAGQPYIASIWARGAVGGEQFIIGVDDCNSNGGSPLTLTTTWQRYTKVARFV